MSKFTAGPWKKVNGGLVGANGKDVVLGKSGFSLSTAGSCDEEAIHNGILAGTAPELLAALKHFVECAEKGEVPNGVAITGAKRVIGKALNQG